MSNWYSNVLLPFRIEFLFSATPSFFFTENGMSLLLSRKVNEYNILKQSFLNPCACLKFPLNQ